MGWKASIRGMDWNIYIESTQKLSRFLRVHDLYRAVQTLYFFMLSCYTGSYCFLSPKEITHILFLFLIFHIILRRALYDYSFLNLVTFLEKLKSSSRLKSTVTDRLNLAPLSSSNSGQAKKNPCDLSSLFLIHQLSYFIRITFYDLIYRKHPEGRSIQTKYVSNFQRVTLSF